MRNCLFCRGIFSLFDPLNFPPFDSAEFRVFSDMEFPIRSLNCKFIQEVGDFFLSGTDVEFNNVNFAYVPLNYHCGLKPMP
jgi:hypothetical protein